MSELTKEQAMAKFNLIEREPPGFGMAKTTLATKLMQALSNDGIDRSPTNECPFTNEWLNTVAREFLQAKCEPHPMYAVDERMDVRKLPVFDDARRMREVWMVIFRAGMDKIAAAALSGDCSASLAEDESRLIAFLAHFQPGAPQIVHTPAALSAGYGDQG